MASCQRVSTWTPWGGGHGAAGTKSSYFQVRGCRGVEITPTHRCENDGPLSIHLKFTTEEQEGGILMGGLGVGGSVGGD
jgi:hypothetical protein